MHRDPDLHADIDRPIVGIGNDYPPAFELDFHIHRRGQLLHATRGVMAISTAQGAWATPPEHAVWIPAGIAHAVRMIGAVSTRSAMVAPELAEALGDRCRVIGVSRLLNALLEEAVTLPVEYDEAGRDGLVMQLLVAEIARAPVIPLAVPFPRSEALARRCQEFLAAPSVKSGIDEWANALGLNRRSFTRHFRRETGMSFAEWRQQACLAAALPLIAAGEPITAVAIDLGYDSPASFSTMFRRALGSSPSDHR
jgi:AraC-like DNA-binding protein